MGKNLIQKQFSDSLQKGLGRAFNYLIQNNSEEFRCDLLYACLHNLTYDPQCEESRAEWLFELITLTNDFEYYRQNIIQALPNTTDYWDIQQLYDLAAIWAKQGCKEARQLIYETFKKQQFNESWLGGKQIIEIDGITGLIYVAEIFGSRLLKNNELWEEDYLVSEACDRFGKEIVMKTLEEQSQINPNIQAYLDAVKSHQHNLENNTNSKTTTRRKTFSFDSILDQIEKTTPPFYHLIRFGKYAEEHEIEQIFERLLTETRREQLIKYLWIFRARKLPKIDNILLHLVDTQDNELQEAAIVALAENSNDLIHTLAIKLLQQQPKSIYNRAIQLLIDNYHSGNFKIIESALSICQDTKFNHSIGCDLIKLAQAEKNLELVTCLLWVYENSPCTICRKQAIEILIELKQIPEVLLKECLYDCSFEIRALVKME